MRMGYSKHQVINSFKEVSKDNPNKDTSSLWPAVLCRLREDLVYGLLLELSGAGFLFYIYRERERESY